MINMRFMLFRNKKSIMGIGTLIIFITTIIVSAMAAGIIINSTGLLKESAMKVENAALAQLVTGIDIVNVYAMGNITSQTLNEFELIGRLRPGSDAIQMNQVGLSFTGPNITSSAFLNESKLNNKCTFDNLTPETEFCMVNLFGGNSSVIQEGDLFIIRYKLKEADSLPVRTNFEVSIQPRSGASETLELTTPNLVLAKKVKLR